MTARLMCLNDLNEVSAVRYGGCILDPMWYDLPGYNSSWVWICSCIIGVGPRLHNPDPSPPGQTDTLSCIKHAYETELLSNCKPTGVACATRQGVYYTELQMITCATNSQRERHGCTAYRYHQTEKGTQPGTNRAWRGEYASSPSFQEAASGGERVDSATLFTVVAVIGKGINDEHPKDSEHVSHVLFAGVGSAVVVPCVLLVVSDASCRSSRAS